MMSGLRDSIEEYPVQAAVRLPSWPETRAQLRAEHRAILAAIRAGDVAPAPAFVHGHISGYYQESGPVHGLRRPPLAQPAHRNPLREGTFR